MTLRVIQADLGNPETDNTIQY